MQKNRIANPSHRMPVSTVMEAFQKLKIYCTVITINPHSVYHGVMSKRLSSGIVVSQGGHSELPRGNYGIFRILTVFWPLFRILNVTLTVSFGFSFKRLLSWSWPSISVHRPPVSPTVHHRDNGHPHLLPWQSQLSILSHVCKTDCCVLKNEQHH